MRAALLFHWENLKMLPSKSRSFLNLCFYMDGQIHEPVYLKIQCTALNNFDCRLKSVDTKYTLFDNSGNPLRAELSTVFIEDLDSRQARP